MNPLSGGAAATPRQRRVRRSLLIGLASLVAMIALSSTVLQASAADAGAAPSEASKQDADEGVSNNIDPWQPFNRKMFAFNIHLDENILEPAARGWNYAVPRPAQKGIRNFYDNLISPVRFVNDLLQAEFDPAVVILSRFVVNTTIGLAGLFDPATKMGLPSHRANFGQTLGRWGVPPGPYVVWPVMGSSDPRATAGAVVDGYLGVTSFFFDWPIMVGAYAVERLNFRAMMADQINSAREASFDLYAAARDAYFQDREHLVKGADRARADRDEELYFPDAEGAPGEQ